MNIRPYLSIPFKERGRDLKGCDCWGLVRIIYQQEFSIDLESYVDDYKDTKDRSGIKAIIPAEAENSWIEIKKGHEEKGDIIVLRIRNIPWHVGVVAGKLNGERVMLHTERGSESTIQSYEGVAWEKRVQAFYRHRSMMHV